MRQGFVFSLCVMLTVCASVWGVGGNMGGADPNGSPEKPYLIEDLADFDTFANPTNAATYWAAGVHTKLMTDIDLAGRTYTTAVIAPDTDNTQYYYQGIPFSGEFNGMNNVISNLHINNTANSYLGLFGEIDTSGCVSNLIVENIVISGHHYIGGLAGSCVGTIQNCSTTGSVEGLDNLIGGLVGRNYSCIRDCFSMANVDGNGYAGGFAGGNIGTIMHCYSTGNVQGGTGRYIGGFVGVIGGSIRNCYATGQVDGDMYVGGFAGKSSALVEQCFARGDVTGSSDVGGFIGYHSGFLVCQCYSTGQVSGTIRVGGLIGRGPGFSMYYAVDSFWDKETSKRTSSVGGTGLTTEQMKDINTYLSAGWDFVNEINNGTCNYWIIPQNDYPALSTFNGYFPTELEGDGTVTSPYLISDANDFGTVWYRPSAHYRLISNVDFAGTEWTVPVISQFTGTLDGNNYSVKNIDIDGNRIFQGFFGKIREGVINNFRIIDSSVHGGNWVGSLAGYNDEGGITGCYALCNVSGEDGIGGLVGISTGHISHSNSFGDVAGDNEVGGLVGELGSSAITVRASIDTCSASGQINGSNLVGGLVGENYYGHIISSFSSGYVTCSSSYTGGLVGLNRNVVEKCYSIGTVNGSNSVGGLVGKNEGWGKTVNSYSSGSVVGSTNVGGLVGWNDECEIENCYATGNIKGGDKVGGLVGFSDGYYDDMDYIYRGIVINSYSTGLVTATGADIGGLIGKNYRIMHENISNCFWDEDTSEMSLSAGGAGKTTSEMMTQSTFTGWDFTTPVWMMLRPGEDTPRLAWQEVFDGDIAGLYGVDMVDFAYLANYWGLTGCNSGTDCGRADIDGSGDVGLGDLVYVAQDWLK